MNKPIFTSKEENGIYEATLKLKLDNGITIGETFQIRLPIYSKDSDIKKIMKKYTSKKLKGIKLMRLRFSNRMEYELNKKV